MSRKKKTPARTRVICRIAGCPHCLRYNRVPWDWTRYRCGHCGGRVDNGPDPPAPKTESEDDEWGPLGENRSVHIPIDPGPFTAEELRELDKERPS